MQKGGWPWPDSRKIAAKKFGATCQGVPGKPWTQVNPLNEGGLVVEKFVNSFTNDPPILPPSPK
jgi:hypothetical protein